MPTAIKTPLRQPENLACTCPVIDSGKPLSHFTQRFVAFAPLEQGKSGYFKRMGTLSDTSGVKHYATCVVDL